ncbi:Ser/Thr protein phosphatase [Tritrichomonas foetus]|uniref:Serine/threonine-protein phosphatase n=1 Tax=Tritrichomonas foetus TaxID=1144522 RepID=A0A1J4K4B4_9EUKA|nr:Ser/Thr protein phosphatase [Tritrichomonas foetus]|eukprot:OHT06289.1 Ser/Thr protein phosphatase [Tritrichomonas foetus]
MNFFFKKNKENSERFFQKSFCLFSKNKMEDSISSLDKFIGQVTDISRAYRFSVVFVRWLCNSVSSVFLNEPSLLEIEPPVNICGDIHGQYLDLLRVFENGGMPPDAKYLFLGDYVDRGEKSVEVITLLFALKLRYPENIFLLRGNHESPEMTELFGFADECKRKLNGSMWPVFLKTFDTMPIGAVVGGQYFCIHGGLSPELKLVDDVRNIKRPTAIPESGLLADLLWSDPSPKTKEWGPNDRGSTITWGARIANRFLSANKLSCVVRGHQMANDGFEFPFFPSRNTVTVFTASKYANEYNNKAAYMAIEDKEGFSFTILPSRIPKLNLMREKVTVDEEITVKEAPKRPPTARRTKNSVTQGKRATGRMSRR